MSSQRIKFSVRGVGGGKAGIKQHAAPKLAVRRTPNTKSNGKRKA